MKHEWLFQCCFATQTYGPELYGKMPFESIIFQKTTEGSR